jgi:hypothetical protein
MGLLQKNEVYTHCRGDTGKVFYIGSGRPDRKYNTKGRNEDWNKINESVGFTVRVLVSDISAEKAMALEFDFINQVGLSNLVNRTNCNGSIAGGHKYNNRPVVYIGTGEVFNNLRHACIANGENYSTNQNRMYRESGTKKFNYI